MNTAYWQSPLGMIEIIEKDNLIIRLLFSQQNKESTDVQSPVLIKTIKQLSEYFNQTRQTFDIPLKPIGSDFQLRVWKELQKIPYGETRSYQDIAQNIHNAKACRAHRCVFVGEFGNIAPEQPGKANCKGNKPGEKHESKRLGNSGGPFH